MCESSCIFSCTSSPMPAGRCISSASRQFLLCGTYLPIRCPLEGEDLNAAARSDQQAVASNRRRAAWLAGERDVPQPATGLQRDGVEPVREPDGTTTTSPAIDGAPGV